MFFCLTVIVRNFDELLRIGEGIVGIENNTVVIHIDRLADNRQFYNSAFEGIEEIACDTVSLNFIVNLTSHVFVGHLIVATRRRGKLYLLSCPWIITIPLLHTAIAQTLVAIFIRPGSAVFVVFVSCVFIKAHIYLWAMEYFTYMR